MRACPLCQANLVEITIISHGERAKWRCTGCRALVVLVRTEFVSDPRVVLSPVTSLEADDLIRESGCTPPQF